MNILITGSNGQLGTKFKEVVCNTYHANNYIFANHHDLDITNYESVKNYVLAYDIDLILNCAAYTNVDEAEICFDKANDINALGPEILANVMKNRDGFLIHISTDYVFDGKSSIPKKETDETKPIGVYGKSKLSGEKNIIASGCSYLIFRTSWLYSDVCKNFVRSMYGRLVNYQNLKVVFDQIGSPTNAGDLAEFLFELIEYDHYENCPIGIYHFANKGVASWYDVTMAIAEYGTLGCYNGFTGIGQIEPCLSKEYKTKAERPNYSVLDTSKLENTFTWYDGIPYWRDSLKKTILKLKENEIQYI